MSFPASQFYQAWVQRLRLPWLGTHGRAIMSAWAKVVGDLTVDWGTQANLEHLPEYASAPSVSLIASERQIDAGPTETQAALATRLTGAVPAWQRASSPLGLLLALYYAGFPGAVIVQQNGLAFSLQLPLVPNTSRGDWPSSSSPSSSLVVTNLGTPGTTLQPFGNASAVKALPAAQSWWTFDGVYDFTSRFAVLFPGAPLPPAAVTWATATFTGVPSENAVSVAWNNAFPDTTYKILVGTPTITDGGGPVVVDADGTTKTSTGVTVRTNTPFVGSVDLVAYQVGANPYFDFHPGDLARLRAIIRRWQPGARTCDGIFGLAQGAFWGWPLDTWAGSVGAGTFWGSSTVVSYSP